MVQNSLQNRIRNRGRLSVHYNLVTEIFRRLAEKMSETEMLMEFLYDSRAPNLPSTGLGEVFDRLIWCMNDNGKEILRVRRKWLGGDEIQKVQIALAMDEVFPCDTREEMAEVFVSLVERWPCLKCVCDSILAKWDAQIRP